MMFWSGAPVVAAVSPKLAAWLTPIWILSMGALAGLVGLLAVWGLTWLASRRAGRATGGVVRDGVLQPVFWIVAVLASGSVLGPIVVANPAGMLRSMNRLGSASHLTRTVEIRGGEPGESTQTVDMAFRGDELQSLRLKASEPLLISSLPDAKEDSRSTVSVDGVDEYRWFKGEESVSPLGTRHIDQLYVTNLSGVPASLDIEVQTQPVYPQMAMIPITAVAIVAFFLLYVLQHLFLPKISAVALATSKSEVVQPLFLILMGLGVFLIVVFVFVPYNTFGEDIKMLKDSAFSLILVFCLIQAIWAASNSVSEEIEGRTALTVLSKPVGRRQFILGKFFGITWSVALLFIVLGVVLLLVVAYKPVYDARETSNLPPSWELCFREMAYTIPGLVLAFLEVVVLTGLSVAISTRLPLLANFSICFSIYVLGHLTPAIVKSSIAEFEPVAFFGQLIAAVFPVLDHFNIQAAVAAGAPVPWSYLGAATVYCILYSVVAMLLALTLFEDRDLA